MDPLVLNPSAISRQLARLAALGSLLGWLLVARPGIAGVSEPVLTPTSVVSQSESCVVRDSGQVHRLPTTVSVLADDEDESRPSLDGATALFVDNAPPRITFDVPLTLRHDLAELGVGISLVSQHVLLRI
jgi:hypothetical protein